MAKLKLLYLVLDGAPDSLRHRPTALEAANKPGLDSLASRAYCGYMRPLGEGVAPESDTAVLSLLGYNPHKHYTGRGPLEALGVGLRLREGYEVAFRANFATIDEATKRIIDRRVGRSLSSTEAAKLAEAVDGIRLSGGGYAKVRATIGHRAVVIIGSHSSKLSDMVSNTDPAYERRGLISVAVKKADMAIRECKPLVNDPAAAETCRLVNEFTLKSIEILSKHPVNIERERKGLPKANALLLRDAGGKLPRLEPLTEKYGLKAAAAIVEMPVEKGIAVSAGLRVYEVSPPTGSLERDLPERLEKTLKALEENELVYVHLKGPDEPGHDGNLEAKIRAIEQIDKLFVGPLLDEISLDEVAILVTSDHATPWTAKAHTDDPVPFMLSWSGAPKGPGRFTEKDCIEHSGSIRLDYGWQLLKLVYNLLAK